MYPTFLPAIVGQLTENESIALAKSMQRQAYRKVSEAIATPLSSQPIATTYVQYCNQVAPAG